jgi:hypothetical protein
LKFSKNADLQIRPLLKFFANSRPGFFFDFVWGQVCFCHALAFDKSYLKITLDDIKTASVADELIFKLLTDGKTQLLDTVKGYFSQFQGKVSSAEIWHALFFFHKMHNNCIYFRVGAGHDAVDAGLAPLVKFACKFECAPS